MTDVQQIAAEITRRSSEIRSKIDELMESQEDLQDDILALQRAKRAGEPIDDAHLDSLKDARREADDMIGVLAMERTELLDDLPVIRTATGRLKVIAAELEQDDALIERATERLEKVTKTLQTAEKVIVKVIGLATML